MTTYAASFPLSNVRDSLQYSLDLASLDPNKGHMFSSAGEVGLELIVATALEYYVLHPNTRLNEQLQVNVITLNRPGAFIGPATQIIHYSFPKTYMETCDKVANLYSLERITNPRILCLEPVKGQRVSVAFGSASNLLFYKHLPNTTRLSEREIRKELDLIAGNGDVFHQVNVADGLETPIRPVQKYLKLHEQSLKRMK